LRIEYDRINNFYLEINVEHLQFYFIYTMYNKICLVLALCLITMSIKISHEQKAHDALPGGWTSIDVKNLTKQQKAVDLFIRGSEEQFIGA
jgi:hypothetical protein